MKPQKHSILMNSGQVPAEMALPYLGWKVCYQLALRPPVGPMRFPKLTFMLLEPRGVFSKLQRVLQYSRLDSLATKECFPSCFLRFPMRALHLPRRLLLSCAKSHMLSASRRQPHLLHVSAVDRRQTWSMDKS